MEGAVVSENKMGSEFEDEGALMKRTQGGERGREVGRNFEGPVWELCRRDGKKSALGEWQNVDTRRQRWQE
jgi:hypothetical protein